MDLLSGLGVRAQRRMTPRIGIALAGAGALIAIVGALGIGGDNLTAGDGDGDLNRIPGVLVSIALVGAGLAVLQRIRSGPLATGASVAVAVGIPALLVFATVKDEYPGFAFDVTILVATVAWTAAYLVGPARGRLLFLTLALVGAVLFVLEQAEDISTVPREMGNAIAYSFFGVSDIEDSSEYGDYTPPPEPQLPDPTTVGGILLGFGVVYAAASHVASRRGLDGTGTPFAPLSVVAVALGIAFLSEDLDTVPSGMLLVAFGFAFALVGAMAARRFTSWAGAAMLGLGVVILIAEALGDTDGTPAYVVILLTGLAVVFAAHLLVEGIGEVAEEDQRRSLRPDAPRAGHEPGPPPDEAFAPPTTSS